MGARFRAPLSGLQASPINLVAANLGSVILLKLLNAGNYAGGCRAASTLEQGGWPNAGWTDQSAGG